MRLIVHTLDPLRDERWNDLVDRDPHASVFHSTRWLRTLKQTYGYQPIAFTTSEPGTTLADGLPFCEVRSWLTGRRLVSLPFSDHCEPLAEPSAFLAITAHLQETRRRSGWDYVELRPQSHRFTVGRDLIESERFWFHALDLRPGRETLFAAFHKDSIQRKIHKARREGVAYDEGRSDSMLREFYDLLVLTRRRHHLPPQPPAWFGNLAAAFGEALKVRVARHGGRTIAAILTIRHRDTMVYKYGGSDAKCHALGGVHLLFWETIQDAEALGCTTFDLGRCDTDNHGLAMFKERWGASRTGITYCRYGAGRSATRPARKYATRAVRQLLDRAPAVCRVAAGRFLYRHAG